jgi:hypothetical protein
VMNTPGDHDFTVVNTPGISKTSPMNMLNSDIFFSMSKTPRTAGEICRKNSNILYTVTTIHPH